MANQASTSGVAEADTGQGMAAMSGDYAGAAQAAMGGAGDAAALGGAGMAAAGFILI